VARQGAFSARPEINLEDSPCRRHPRPQHVLGGCGRLPVDLHRPGLPGALRRGARDRGPGRRRGVNELGDRLGCRRPGARRPSRAAHRLLRRHHRGAACAGRGGRGGGRGRGRRRRSRSAAHGLARAGAGRSRRALPSGARAAAAALCGAARHAAADAEECLAGIDSALPGLLATGEL
jgi:hypothetical protein